MPVRSRGAKASSSKSARQAATLVIQTHGPAVLRYLRALLRDQGTVDDAFSLFGEWVWRGIPNFRGEAPLRTWALGVAWNAAQRVRDEAWQKHKARLSTGFARGWWRRSAPHRRVCWSDAPTPLAASATSSEGTPDRCLGTDATEAVLDRRALRGNHERRSRPVASLRVRAVP